MSFKKSVQNVPNQKPLKTENNPADKDINVAIAGCSFRAREENLDCKISYGRNMSGTSKLYRIYPANIAKAKNG